MSQRPFDKQRNYTQLVGAGAVNYVQDGYAYGNNLQCLGPCDGAGNLKSPELASVQAAEIAATEAEVLSEEAAKAAAAEEQAALEVRTELEARAAELGIAFTEKTRNSTLEKKIDQASEAQKSAEAGKIEAYQAQADELGLSYDEDMTVEDFEELLGIGEGEDRDAA